MHLGIFTGSSPLSGVPGVMAVVVYAHRYNLKIIYSPDLGRVVSGQPARPLRPGRRGQPSARQRGSILTFGAGFTSLLSIIGWESKFRRACAQYPIAPPPTTNCATLRCQTILHTKNLICYRTKISISPTYNC